MAENSSQLIPDHFNKRFFEEALEAGLRFEDIEILSFDIHQPLIGGENYCSTIYHALLVYKAASRCQEISVIIKSLPKHKQGVLRDLHVFRKESLFYLDIKPKLETVMWQAAPSWQLGAKHIFSTAQPEQTIILQDLGLHGFTLESRQQGLDENHAAAVLKKLAQYHASTMVMAIKEPETVVDNFPHGLLNTASINAPAFKALFGAQLLKVASMAAEWPGFENISSKLYQYHEKFSELVTKAIYPLEGIVNVLNHGDLWVNNILFRDQKVSDSGLETEVRFVDFQLCFYGSLGFDLNYFFNTSLQLEVLQNRREVLLEIYFKSLSKTLKRISNEITPPSLDLIKKEFAAREGYGFFVAFGFLPLMAMDSMDSKDNSLENFHSSEFAAKKIELMFQRNGRTLKTLQHILRRLDELEVLPELCVKQVS